MSKPRRKTRKSCRWCATTEDKISQIGLCLPCTRVHALIMKWKNKPEELKRNIEQLKKVIAIEESILKGINPVTEKEIKVKDDKN